MRNSTVQAVRESKPIPEVSGASGALKSLVALCLRVVAHPSECYQMKLYMKASGEDSPVEILS